MRLFSFEKTTPVDEHIANVLEEMHLAGPDTEEYPKLMTSLERLYELKAKTRRPPVSRDALVTVGGNLLVVLLIVACEQNHVMTSKALSYIIKPK